LYKPGRKINYLLHSFGNRVHLVGCIAVQKKRMKKQRKKPMRKKENKNNCHEYLK
jgi:hypothetical protein